MWDNVNSTAPGGMQFSWQGICQHKRFVFRVQGKNEGFYFETNVSKVCADCGQTLRFDPEDMILFNNAQKP